MINNLNITTPALMFSAISLILLAYTNRFLSYAQVVRNLYAEYQKNKDVLIKNQINNLRKRLSLIKIMQLSGVLSLFLSMASMLFIYFQLNFAGQICFVLGMIAMIFSLLVSIREIQISIDALDMHLKNME